MDSAPTSRFPSNQVSTSTAVLCQPSVKVVLLSVVDSTYRVNAISLTNLISADELILHLTVADAGTITSSNPWGVFMRSVAWVHGQSAQGQDVRERSIFLCGSGGNLGIANGTPL
jgi:hypothetical protein